MITITHTPEDGTVVAGDPRPHHTILKNNGFRWSRQLDGWYIRGSRDRAPEVDLIERVAGLLRDVGFEVTVDIATTMRSAAEREVARIERIERRQDALAAKAARKLAESEALEERRRQMADVIPFGQPILVGHHSERRHRNALDRMHRLDGKSIEAWRDGQEAARKAEASEANEAHRESGPATIRRIERLNVELRDIDRKLTGKPCSLSGRRVKEHAANSDGHRCPLCGTEGITYTDVVPDHYQWDGDRPASGEWLERLTARRAVLVDDIGYWTGHLESLRGSGVFEQLGPDDFEKGDRVLANGHPGTVVRVNKKSLTVRVDVMGQFTSTYGYDRIKKMEMLDA